MNRYIKFSTLSIPVKFIMVIKFIMIYHPFLLTYIIRKRFRYTIRISGALHISVLLCSSTKLLHFEHGLNNIKLM